MLNLRTRPEQDLSPIFLFHGLEKWGKTSLAAMAKNPVFILSKGEDGLESLISKGQLPETPYFDVCRNWVDLIQYCNQLVMEKHDRKTLVLDVVRGFERMLEEHVIATRYRGQAERYHEFAAGRKFSVPIWKSFLHDTLESVRRKGMTIIFLAHSKTKSMDTPLGEKYLNYHPDSEECFWDESKKWVDQICHLTRKGLVDRDLLQRAKKYGDDYRNQNMTIAESRVICCDQTIFYTAGGRFGLPEQIDLPTIDKPRYPWEGAEAGWTTFYSTVKSSMSSSIKAARKYSAEKAASAQQEQPKEEPKKAPPKEEPKREPAPEASLPPTNHEPITPDREPGVDEESPEDRPASEAQRKMVLNLLTKLKKNWPNAETQEEISKCIGRDLPQPARTDHLTWGEADLLVSHYTAKLEAKAERAAKKEDTANADR